MSDFFETLQNEIQVISAPDEQNPFAVIYKPHGIPSAPLANCSGKKNSAIEIAASIFPEIKTVNGKLAHEYGLLHRLDTDASGIVLIATTQDAYDFLFEMQRQGRFEKSYKAHCIFFENNSAILGGFPHFNFFSYSDSHYEFRVASFFRSYGKGGKEVRPVTNLSGKFARRKISAHEYETHIEISKSQINGNIYDADCTIVRGFRHQVRCHLAWCGFPVIGDKIYNANQNIAPQTLKFCAYKISFVHPYLKKKITIELRF